VLLKFKGAGSGTKRAAIGLKALFGNGACESGAP